MLIGDNIKFVRTNDIRVNPNDEVSREYSANTTIITQSYDNMLMLIL